MKKADEIFLAGNYSRMVTELQDSDKKKTFRMHKVPKWYLEKKEPKSSPGIYKGLSVMLDAHTDWLSSGSVDEDFHGFVAYVNSGDQFPLTYQEGIRLKAGHENLVKIKPVKHRQPMTL